MTEKQNSDIPFYFKQQESDIFIVQFKNLEKVPFIQHFSEKLDSLIIQGPLRSVGYSIIPHSCAVLSGRISVQIL